MNKKKEKLRIVLLLLLAVSVMISSCSNSRSKREAQKLLDRQQAALKEGQKFIDETFNQLQLLSDSFESEQEKLVGRKLQIEEEIRKLEADQKGYAETLKEEKVEELELEKSDFQKRLQEIEDSLTLVQNKSEDVEKRRGLIDIKEQQLTEQKSVAKEKLVTGIDDIDSRLDEIESQRLVKQNILSLNEQKINLSRNKIKLLEDEKNIYLREKNDIIKNDGDDAELDKYDLKIDEINGYIEDEQNKIKNAESSNSTLKEWISDADELEEKLRTMMTSEYDRNETIEEFTKEEITRLSKEREALDKDIEKFDSVKSQLAVRKATISERLASFEGETELIKSKELSEILAERSDIESQQAELAEMEKNIIDQRVSSDSIDTVSEITSGFELLRSIENDIRGKREKLDKLQSEITEDEARLSEQMAEIEARRSKNVRAFAGTLVLVSVGVILAGILYILGKRSIRKK